MSQSGGSGVDVATEHVVAPVRWCGALPQLVIEANAVLTARGICVGRELNDLGGIAAAVSAGTNGFGYDGSVTT